MRKSPFFPAGLWNVGQRYILRRGWQSALMVLGIALGVAVMVAIDLANAGASRAFTLSTEAITGKATHQISGGPQGLDEQVYVNLRLKGAIQQAAPVVSAYVSSPQLGSRPMQLLGIDLFADAPFRSYLSGPGTSAASLAQIVPFLTKPATVILSKSLVDRYGLKIGSQVTLDIGGRTKPVTVVGSIDPQDDLTRRTLDGVVLADIATAQELTGMQGRLSWIDLILQANDPSRVNRLQASLPAGVRISPVDARTGTIDQMTSAFRVNLTALSMLALLVGLFLIYNTMTFSVVQRRPLFGTLRCLGVTRREIFMMVAGEALIVGVIGSLAGIGLGILMGQNTLKAVTQTINDLYFTTTVEAQGIQITSLVKGGVLGILATLFTAIPPAWEAASVPPRAALSRSGLEVKAHRAVQWTAVGGLATIALGMVFFLLPNSNLFLGFSGTFAVTVGFAMLAAITMVLLMRLVVPITGRIFGFLGRMAPRNLINSLSRTSVAVAALMVAVAVTVGVTLMIDSFRYTVTVWLGQSLQDDIYMSAPDFNQTQPSVAIDPRIVQKVEGWPGVSRVDKIRSTTIDSPQGPIKVTALVNPTVGQERLFVSALDAPAQIWGKMQSGSVIISESLATRLKIPNRGGTIELYTDQGLQRFAVEGIFYDYASSEGVVQMAFGPYQQYWHDSSLTALGLRLKPGQDADRVTQQLQDALNSEQQLNIRPNAALRKDVLEVFDRTFAITSALRILATIVAFIGVLSALLLLQMEKEKEIGILRALGLTGRQLWRLVMLETGLMGFVAGILAMPTGYALALILIEVINKRSFGWSLQLALSPVAFLQALLISMTAALLAGIYPARKLGRMAAAAAIREE
jgi:putative ABC transport system permease protein